MREKGGESVRRWGKNEEGRRKSDLKEGHVRAKNECDRTFVSAFDRIRAACVCQVGSTFERIGYVQTHECKKVCVRWGTAFEQTQVSSNACPCLRLNAKGTFERTVQSKKIFFFFNYKNIYTKIFTKQNNYKNVHTKTSTPPPNLKRHIAHNVTESTTPRDGSIQV
jgi:hypothetical protein